MCLFTSLMCCGQSSPVASTGMSSYLSKFIPEVAPPNSSLQQRGKTTANQNQRIKRTREKDHAVRRLCFSSLYRVVLAWRE